MENKTSIYYGSGILDADYPVRLYEKLLDTDGKFRKKLTWICPYYTKWQNMLQRCYYDQYKQKRPTYEKAYVCLEWLYFSNFKSWMEQQDWEGKELDKDILFVGNKEYSPDTCVFVAHKTNNFILDRHSKRGLLPIGVTFDKRKDKFSATCYSVVTNKQKFLGYFTCPQEAHLTWLHFKIKQAYLLAQQQTDSRVAKALIDRYENYEYYF